MSVNQSDLKKINNAVKTGEFQIEAIRDNGDSAPPPLKDLENGGSANAQPINYAVALSGFWKFIDMGFSLFASQTKGRIEYTHLTDAEIMAISQQSAQSKHFQQLASMENAPTWLVCVSAIGTFGSHVKVNPKKEDEKKLEKVSEDLTLTKEDIDILNKVVIRKNQQTQLIEDVKKIPESKLKENLQIEPFTPITLNDMIEPEDQRLKEQLFGKGDLTPERLEEIKLFKAQESRRIQKELDEASKRNNGGVSIAT